MPLLRYTPMAGGCSWMKDVLYVGGDSFALLLTSVLSSASRNLTCFFSNLDRKQALFLTCN